MTHSLQTTRKRSSAVTSAQPPQPSQLAPTPSRRSERPVPGQSTPSTVKKEADGDTGGWTSLEKTSAYVERGNGKVVGVENSFKAEAGAGAKGSRSAKSDVFDGAGGTNQEGSAEGLAGAEAAVELISKRSPEEISAALTIMARAGAFGEAKGKTSVRRGKLSAGASGSVQGGAGIQADAEMSAKIDRSGLIPALSAVISASIKAGVWGEAEGKLEAAIGPLAASVVGKIAGWVGGQAEATAKAWANWHEGIGASFVASAQAGTGASAEGTVEVHLGPAQLEVTGSAEVKAGAGAEAKGKFAIGITGLSAKFKAEAWAGFKTEAKAKVAFKMRGKTIAYAKGKVSAMVGVGVEAEGEFTIQGGKLEIGGALGAALKGGGGAGFKVMLDVYTLSDVIVAEVKDYARKQELQISPRSPGYERKPLPPEAAKKREQEGYEALIDDFRAYNAKKMKGGEHGIKKDRLQAMIQNRAGQLHEALAYSETDRGIERAAREAFGDMLKSFMLDAGYIRSFQAQNDNVVKAAKEAYQKDDKFRSARDGLVKDLNAYGDKKAKIGKNGVKPENVQSLVNKRWKAIKEVLPEPGKADAAVREAIEQALGDYITSFDIAEGKLSNVVAPASQAERVKAEAKEDAGAAARNAALATLKGKLAAYKAGVVKDPKKNVDKTEIATLVKSSTSKIKDQLTQPGTDNAISAAIAQALHPLVDASGVIVDKGEVKEVKPKVGGLAQARQDKKAGDEKDAQAAAIANLATSLENYLEAKTQGGTNGVKEAEVQKRVDKCTAKVRDWVQSGAADEELTQTIQDSLKTMVTQTLVVKGQVSIYAPKALAASVKKERKQNGKARLGGEEDDNQRRRMIDRALRSAFSSYAAEIRADAESPGTPAPTTLQRGRLQSIIDKKLKTIRADAVNEVGDEQVMATAKDTFRQMLKSIDVSKLQVIKLEPDPNFLQIAKNKRDESAAVRTAIADLQADLTHYARACADEFHRAPTKEFVQKIIDKHKAKFAVTDPDEADTAMTLAVHTAFRNAVENVEITGAKLTAFTVAVTAGNP